MSNLGLILGYSHFYNDTPPANRFDLIRNISKIDLLGELAASNYRLKPPLKIFFEYPIQDQLNEISYNLRLHPEVQRNVYYSYINHLENTSSNALVFNRAGLLFAMNEIITCNELNDINGFQFSGYDQENIFKYILLVNEEVTVYNENIFNISSYSNIESLNLASLALNEYFIPFDPLFTLHIGGQLFNFLNESEYRESLNEYLSNSVGIEQNRFIYEITNMYMTNHMQNRDLNFFYRLNEDDSRIAIFDFFSRRNVADSASNFEFIDIRKSPFYRYHQRTFLLLDNMFLLSKSYYFFIWDFLYDVLLDGVTNNDERVAIIKNYKGVIGIFFEQYIKEILHNAFENNSYKIKLFEKLKIRINHKEKELADIYIKSKNKIIIGQAKSTSIINKEKYAEDLNKFYGGRPNKFFEKHGLFQLVRSIREIIDYGKLIDNSIPKKRIKIFPIIIFNDLLLNNFLFPQVFNEKFKDLISEIDDPCVNIYPLILIHISDLQVIEYSLNKKHNKLFKLLKYHLKKGDMRIPFYLTANEHRNSNYPERVMEYFRNIINENNPNNN